MSETNRDEAERCIALAQEAAKEGDPKRAERLLIKSLRMCPSDKATQLLKSLSEKPGGPTESPMPTAPSDHKTEKVKKKTQEQKDEPQAAPQFTKKQRDMAESVLKAGTLYDVLGVGQSAADDEIKKAYRKLALQLHPDKNKAPKAEEAFKRVAKAFQCLSEPEKRKLYDQCGEEDSGATSVSRGHRGGYEDDFISAEDLFRMFFEGVPLGARRTYHQSSGHFGRGHVRAHQHHQQQGGTNRMTAQQQKVWQVFQLLPLIVIVLSFLFGTSWNESSVPKFSMERSRSLNHKLFTREHGVPFFVNGDFESSFPTPNQQRQEVEVTVDWKYFSGKCRSDHQGMWRDFERARSLGMSRKAKTILDQLRKMEEENPNCQVANTIQNTNPKLIQAVQQKEYYYRW